jgi:hypothetical protein
LAAPEFSISKKDGIARELILPYANGVLDMTNKFVRLPSLADFDFPGIKLSLFKNHDPSITSISDAENKRKQGFEYEN